MSERKNIQDGSQIRDLTAVSQSFNNDPDWLKSVNQVSNKHLSASEKHLQPVELLNSSDHTSGQALAMMAQRGHVKEASQSAGQTEKQGRPNEAGRQSAKPATREKQAAELPAPTPVAPVHVSKVREVTERMFNQLDSNHDGRLSEDELGDAVKSKAFKGQDAQVLAALYQNSDRIGGLVRDGAGISHGDLAKFDELQKSKSTDSESALRCRLFAEKHFHGIDKNHDGFVSAQDLDEALKQNNWSQQERETLKYMRDNVSKLQKYHSDEPWYVRETKGITLDDINSYSRDTVVHSVQAFISRTAESQSGVDRLYGNKNPLESIKPEAVQQGVVGNCNFLAAVKSIAATHPELIAKMITDNGDGTYTVKFPGNPIAFKVKAPTEAEMGLYAAGGKHGNWVAVLEKAYGEYRFQGGRKPVQESANGGETIESAYGLLTGHGADTLNAKFPDKEVLRKRLEAAFSSNPKQEVMAGIFKEGWDQIFGGDRTAHMHFLKNHAYSIVGYDPRGANGGTILIANPYGRGDGTDGLIRISFEDFTKNFSSLIIGNPSKPAGVKPQLQKRTDPVYA